jgi:hypothetical protein
VTERQAVSIEQACKGGMGVRGKGGAHLLVDDADQVLDAISFQGSADPLEPA